MLRARKEGLRMSPPVCTPQHIYSSDISSWQRVIVSEVCTIKSSVLEDLPLHHYHKQYDLLLPVPVPSRIDKLGVLH